VCVCLWEERSFFFFLNRGDGKKFYLFGFGDL